MKKLIPNHIRDLVPYSSARSINVEGDIWLNANESPWNQEIIRKFYKLNRYPQFQSKKLLLKYATYIQCDAKNIIITRGADEAIELLMRTFCIAYKDAIIFCPPTYDMYEVSAKILGIRAISIPLLKTFQLNLNCIYSYLKEIKLIYICHPNNPTGNIVLKEDVLFILNNIPNHVILVIDEAYIEFSENNSFIFLLSKYKNLVILRTLSKAFGLAGIRCGFIVSNINIVNILKKVLAPYPIPTPISDIAINALSAQNISIMKNRVLLILKNKNFLLKSLSKFSFVKNIYSSHTNFILIKFIESKFIFDYLLKNKIVLRDQSNKIYLKNCLRVSIGIKEECQQLINVLKALDKDKKY